MKEFGLEFVKYYEKKVACMFRSCCDRGMNLEPDLEVESGKVNVDHD